MVSDIEGIDTWEIPYCRVGFYAVQRQMASFRAG